MSEAVIRSDLLKPGVTVYFARHGETDWNRDARYQGQADIPLNDTGRMQARRNGDALRALLPKISEADYVSSPLIRAVETMRIMRGCLGLDPDDFARNPVLKEVSYGHWEGHLLSELPIVDPDGVAARALDPYGWRPRGGESYADLSNRAMDWLKTVNRNSVIVSHGGVSRVLRQRLLGLDGASATLLESPQDRILVMTSEKIFWL